MTRARVNPDRCIRPDCPSAENVQLRRGLCFPHYKAAWAAGTLPPKATREHCSHDGCECFAVTKEGLCNRHHKRAEAAKRKANTPVPHGLHRYVKFKCRCDACRAAHTAYRKKTREEQRKKTAREGWHGAHGTYYAYWTAGCRCTECMAWHDTRHRKREAPRPARVLRNVYTELGGGSSVAHWMPAEGDIHTCPDCGAGFAKQGGQWVAVRSASRDETSHEPARSREGA